MTQVLYQQLSIGICGKGVGRHDSQDICGESVVLLIGDSNLQAIISGQCEVAGEILYNSILYIIVFCIIGFIIIIIVISRGLVLL